MAVDYATQVCVIIFYTDGRRLDYGVDMEQGVTHGDILEAATLSAPGRAAAQFDVPDATLDFVVLATTPGEYRRYLDKDVARANAAVAKPLGLDRMHIDVAGHTVVFPMAFAHMAQQGIATVFCVRTVTETYLLEAREHGVVLLFIGAEPSQVFYEQTPGEHQVVLPTGEAYDYIVLPPNFSMVEALRPLMEHIATRL